MKRFLLFFMFFSFVFMMQAKELTYMTTFDFTRLVYNFKKDADKWVNRNSQPVVIDFYTTWCGPCKRVAPLLAELNDEYAGKVSFYRVDIEQETELAKQFGIRSVPTLFFIPTNGEAQRIVGARSKEDLKQQIESILSVSQKKSK